MKCPVCGRVLEVANYSPHGMWWCFCGRWEGSHFLLEEKSLFVLFVKWLWHTVKK